MLYMIARSKSLPEQSSERYIGSIRKILGGRLEVMKLKGL